MAAALNEALGSARPPTIAAVSASSAAGWQRLTRIHAVLRNGVPVDQVPWSEEAGRGLLFAGRFSAEKGAADAIAIAEQAELPIELYGEPYDQDYFRERIEPQKRRPGVTIHQGVPRPQLWRAMARSLAVLCPAKWAEPFGMAAAEAQAAGTPVIAYEAGALVEIVVHEKTGFLVPAGDVAAAVRATEAVRSISRVHCRRHAEASLNLAQTITSHERLYQQVQTGEGATSRA
jgi:glycosyltransferase involved in cell wall biosynthesis